MKAIFLDRDRSANSDDLSHLTERQRADVWVARGEHGLSSFAIWAHMVGAAHGARMSYPLDPSDLNRCLKLIALVPEWKSRISEMGEHGGKWKALANNWEDLEDCFIAEAGVNWSKASSAPKTYKMMKDLQK